MVPLLVALQTSQQHDCHLIHGASLGPMQVPQLQVQTQWPSTVSGQLLTLLFILSLLPLFEFTLGKYDFIECNLVFYLEFISTCSLKIYMAGETSQQFKVFASLADSIGFSPSTNISGSQPPRIPISGNWCLPLATEGICPAQMLTESHIHLI